MNIRYGKYYSSKEARYLAIKSF